MTAVTEQVVHDGTHGTVTIRPLQPTIGAEISGVDLSRPLTDAERDQIKAAVLKYKVVFFRDQVLDQDQHAAFARQFGHLSGKRAVMTGGCWPRASASAAPSPPPS